jgi:hypothetical protein
MLNNDSDKNFGRNIQFFNAKTKINIQAVTKKSNKYPTLNISLCLNDEANQKWENKIVVQVNPEKELPELARCLLKKTNELEARFHSKEKNKGYRVKWSPDFTQLDVSISNKGEFLFYRLTGGEVFHFAAITFEQLKGMSGSLSVSEIISILG